MFALVRVRTANKLIKNVPKILVNQIHSHKIQSTDNADLNLKVDIKGVSHQFPYVWLRDNCMCEKCFHYSAKSRILDWKSYFDPNVRPANVIKDQNSLQITWPDGHTSVFKYEWLTLRSFLPEHQKYYSETIYRPKKLKWNGREFEEIFSKHDYNDIVNSEEALYDWLLKLSKYGVALIENTPNSETALDAIVAKIGFTKQTHYGVKFIVQNIVDTNNVAYQNTNLQLHTDLSYYEYSPGVNLLHCYEQTSSKGGENLLSDSHYVAEYIKVNHPEEYKLLTDIDVEWRDVGVDNGNEFFKLYRAPVIMLDKYGDITRINFSIPQRGSHFPGSIEDVLPWYKAYSLFFKVSHDFAAKFKSKAGNILAFDNIRVIHGRSAYEDNQNNVRKLIGGYVDWDEIYSRLRCLKVKLEFEKGMEKF